jgi:hypothetical protein
VIHLIRNTFRLPPCKYWDELKRDINPIYTVVNTAAASVQDRDGATQALLGMYVAGPVRFVFADAGFAGQLVDWAARILAATIEVVRKPKGQKGFAVIPRRWAVERTLAWLTAHRRLARDYERDPACSEAMIRWAAINGMLRRLDPRPCGHLAGPSYL